MKINNTIGIIMAIALVFIAGCTGDDDTRSSGIGSGSSSSNSPDPTGGVSLEFAEGNPSGEIYKGNEVNFAFVFRNNQEHPIENLQLKTGGFDRGFVSGLQEEYTIERISPATDAAGQGVYSGLVEDGVVVDGFNGDYDFNPDFDYCYEATSTHQESICVPSQNNQCEVDVEEETSANGPLTVGISSINSLENSILVRFDVENSGPGQVVNECFNTDDYGISYSVEAELGAQAGECSPQGADEFLLNDGESGSFQCEFSRTSDSSYSTQLSLDIDHTYQQSTQKQIDVINLNQ